MASKSISVEGTKGTAVNKDPSSFFTPSPNTFKLSSKRNYKYNCLLFVLKKFAMYSLLFVIKTAKFTKQTNDDNVLHSVAYQKRTACLIDRVPTPSSIKLCDSLHTQAFIPYQGER